METPLPPIELPRRQRARIVPVLLTAICAGVIAWSQFDPRIEGNFRGVYSILAMLGWLVLMALWVLFLSGMPVLRRLIIVAGGILVLVTLGFLVRREGSFTGAGFPRFVWIWTPRYVVAPLQLNEIRYDKGNLGSLSRSQTRPASPDDFPQFLGPDRDNQVRNAKLSRDWSTHPPQFLWRRQMGLGWSGFAVVGQDAITMEQRDEEESTICYDLTTGEPQWVHTNHVYLHEPEGGDGPRATPTIFHDRVYVLGGLGNLDCLDLVSGSPIWSHAVLDNPAKHLRYGQTSSPLIIDQMVIVTGGMSKQDDSRPSLFAFDRKTGDKIWQCMGDPASYASPSLATLGGVRQILCLHQNTIAGHDIADGHVLWQFTWAPGFWPKNSQAMPIGNDRLYCSTGYGIGSIVLQISNSNGQLSATEVWRKTTMKTELSNVVIRGDYLVGLDDGYLLAQDLATGQKIWRGDRFGHGQILQAGDLLLAQTEGGEIALLDVLRSGATELGRFTALTKSKNCWNTPALAGHYLLVRSDKEAACFKLP
jgi:outer membrane protein assembly factor BamB